MLILVVSGCASHSPAANTVPAKVYAPAPASSLAFDPPVLHGEPSAFLPRDERQPSAFVGYDGGTVTTFYILTDDRAGQPNDTPWLERRAIIERTGVSFP